MSDGPPAGELRLIASDMDSTLLSTEAKTISAENLEALVSLAQCGAQVLLASGRHLSRMAEYHEQLRAAGIGDGPIISCNGAVVTIGGKTVVRGVRQEHARGQVHMHMYT